MDPILQKPLRDIERLDELLDLFHAIPDKHLERLAIIEKIENLARSAPADEQHHIRQAMQGIQSDKQKDLILSALHIPWGDWSRIYRLRGLPRAIDYIERLLQDSETRPNILYNLAFLYYIAYGMLRDEQGRKNPEYRRRALELAGKAQAIYRREHIGRLEQFMTRMGSLIIHEWRKNLPEYCLALTCNIVSLINLLDQRYDEALESINESFEPHPTPPEIYFSMGIYFLRKGAFNPAIRMLNESIKKRGEHSAEAFYQLGRVYYLKVRHFQKEIGALTDGADDVRRRRHLKGLIDKRIQKAMDAFQASLGEDPYFPLPYYWMGLTYLLKTDCHCQTAIDHIEMALRLDPRNISRYLKTYPPGCQADNPSCNRKKIGLLTAQLIEGH